MKINKWILTGVLLLAAIIIGYKNLGREEGALLVKTAAVQFGPLSSAVTSVGQVEPRSEIVIRAKAAGLISEIRPKEGDWVSAGQEVAKLDSSTGVIIIRSPISGKVLCRPETTDQWASVSAGQELLTVANLNDLIIEAEVNEVDAVNIRKGQSAKVSTDALPGKVFTGIVDSLAAQVKDVDGVAKVLVKLALTSTSSLIPGNKVDVEIQTERRDKTLFVPLEAIFKDSGRKKIFIVKDGLAAAHEVETGISNLNYIEIRPRRPLKAGDTVVVSADPNLTEGAKIEGIKSNDGQNTNKTN